MTKRKFYKTVFRVTVLSEEPLSPDIDLEDISYAITDGGCSGVTEMLDGHPLTGKQVVKELVAQGSDPGFFMLDDKGDDTED